MVAFVAGIENYKHRQKLKNPVRDAKAITQLLEAQNVEVFPAYDCGIDELKLQFDLFEAALRPGDTAFLFFACHAEMFENVLRLIAISNSDKSDLTADALNLSVLLARLATLDPHWCPSVTIHAV